MTSKIVTVSFLMNAFQSPDILDQVTLRRRSNTPLLNFLYCMLDNPLFVDYITWEDFSSGIFKITNPEGLAQIWGQKRGHKNMTYEKMARALRYYYRNNLLKKVNIRGCYQFTQMQFAGDVGHINVDLTACDDPLE